MRKKGEHTDSYTDNSQSILKVYREYTEVHREYNWSYHRGNDGYAKTILY